MGGRRWRADHPRRVPESRRRRPGALPCLPQGPGHRRFSLGVGYRVDAGAGAHLRRARRDDLTCAGRLSALRRLTNSYQPTASALVIACRTLAVVLALKAERQVGATEAA